MRNGWLVVKEAQMTKANKQTIATDKYQKKIGLISKSFKIRKEVAEAYKEACEKAGVGQAAKITELMKNFIEEVEQKNK